MKKFWVLAIFILIFSFPMAFFGCAKEDNSNAKVQLDMTNARWNYNGGFETENAGETNFEVKVLGLPKEIDVTYDGVTSNRYPNEYWNAYPESGRSEYYTVTAHLQYDEEKYELVNDCLPRTLNWKIYDTLYLEKEADKISNCYSEWYGKFSRESIDYLHFVNYIPEGVDATNYMWNIQDEDGENHVYFGLDANLFKSFKLPKDSSYMFSYLYNLKGITGLEYVDFSSAEDLSFMFLNCGIESGEKLEIVFPDNLDLSAATNMRQMFSNVGGTGELVLELGNSFDCTNVSNMANMFYNCGKNSGKFHLRLGEKFDTSNVKDMNQMFYNCGAACLDFYLDMGSGFKVDSVQSMIQMFLNCGKSSGNLIDWKLSFLGELSTECDLSWVFYKFDKDLCVYVDNVQTYALLSAKGYTHPQIVMK